MQHKEYWIKRFEQLTDAQLRKGSEYYYNLQEQYRKAIDNIEKDIAKWYTRYANENAISLTEAKRLLNGRELAEFRMSVKEYIEKGESMDPKWAKQLEAASVRVHVSRLEALQIQIQQQAENVCGGQVDGLDKLAKDIYTDGYYKTAYEVQKGVGVGFDLMQLGTNRIDKLISKPWAADGKNFSARVWENRAALVSELENTLTQSIIRGQSPKKVIADIAQRFNVSKNKACRLIMTESAFFAAAAQKDCFSDLGVEKYEIVATLDSRTSETCRHLDGKVIPMADYKPGVTAPPFHVYCYDKETEVYTNSGWKLFRDLSGKEMVYTINKETLIPEWQKPLKLISYVYNGDLLHFVNDRTDLMVTPNHKLLVQNMDSGVKDKSYKLRTADSIGVKAKNRMLSGCNWIGETVKTATLGGKKVDIETYLRFMAYWLADGSCTKDRNSYNIKIAQCNNDKMAAELATLPFTVYKCKEALMIHNKDLGTELAAYGKCTGKYVPAFIKSLSPELIRIFLEAYAVTDGTIKKGKFWKGYQFADSICFFTTSDQLAADLGELILKAGGRPSFMLQEVKGKEVAFKNGTYTINHDVWVIAWNKQIHSWICYMDVTREAYNDYVYCVEVEKHNTLLVRRRGKVVWSGNCRSTTVPYFDDEFSANDQRAARDENGEYYTVPANMKYPEWKEKFVDGGSKEGLELMSNNFKPQYKKAKAVTIDKTEIPLNKVTNSKFNMYADISEGRRSKAVRLAEKNLQQVEGMLPLGFEMPKIAVVDMEKHFGVNAIGGYNQTTGVMFINSKYDTADKITAYITKTAGEFSNTTPFAPYLHELGHKYYYDSIKKLAKNSNMSYNKAKGVIDDAISDYIHKNNSNGRFLVGLSNYAYVAYGDGNLGEVVAESFAANGNNIASKILELLKG